MPALCRCWCVLQGPVKFAKMTHMTTMMRVAAVVCGILAMHQFGAKAALWSTLAITAAYRETLQEPPRKFINRWTKRFLETGNVDSDLPRKKKRKVNAITDGEARLAAQLFKNGYWVERQCSGGAGVYRIQLYYSSTAVACRHNAELKAIRDQYGLTNRQLFREMKRVDPYIKRRAVRVKLALSPDLKHKRQQRAKSLYARWRQDHNFTNRIYFIDECKVWIDFEAKKSQHVYCDAFDQGFKTAMHYDKMNPNQSIRVHFMVAVNPVHGPMYLEFTTGTTNIQRRNYTHDPYKVSGLHSSSLRRGLGFRNDGVVICIRHNVTIRQHVGQHLRIRQQLPLFKYVYSSVSWGQYNSHTSGSSLNCWWQIVGVCLTTDVCHMHPYHANTTLHSSHTKPQIIIQPLPCTLLVHLLKVATAVSL